MVFLQPLEQFEINLFPVIDSSEKNYFFNYDMRSLNFLDYFSVIDVFFYLDNFLKIYIDSIFGYNIFFVLLFFILLFFFRISLFRTNIQNWGESFYKFIFNIMDNQIGREYQSFFPVLYFLFGYILFSNLVGLLPFNFTVTSQLLVTFNLSFSVFIGITLIGLIKHKFDFILLFVPKNVPTFLLDFLFLIEVVSYISRVFSLAIRLFANMLSGHALIFILSGFVVNCYKNFGLVFDLRFLIIVVIALICFLEIGICFLQAYVFVILVAIYYNDAVKLAH